MFLFAGSIWTDLLCILIALCTVIYTYSKWIYQTFKKKDIPYFEPTFPLGNLHSPYKRIPIYVDICNTVKRAKAKGWNHFGLYIILNPFFVPLDLDIIKCILTKDFDHFVDRGFYYNEKDDPLSAHLFALGGQKWKNLRAKLTPTFTSGKMKAMLPTLKIASSLLERTLEGYAGKEPIDIKNILVKYTQDVIGSIAFGLECNSFKETETPFQKYSRKMVEKSIFVQLSDLFNETFPNLARALHRKWVPTDVSNFFMDVLTKTARYRQDNNITRNDFLQLLLDIRKENGEDDELMLTFKELAAQCFVFFLAGFETTASTITFAMYEISRHPRIQEKLREELFTVLKKHDNNISYEFLKDLRYMEQILEETLRKYPAVPLITRQCIKDYKIPNTNVFLKKGNNVMIPIRGIHYDESIYENPDEFDPERFSPENKTKRHQYAYMPFGEGPRTCIGMRFALMESKLTLSKILSKFRTTLNDKTITPLEMNHNSLVPAAKGGIWLSLEKLSQ